MASIIRRVLIGGVLGVSAIYTYLADKKDELVPQGMELSEAAKKMTVEQELKARLVAQRQLLTNPFSASPLIDVEDASSRKALERLAQCEQAELFVAFAKSGFVHNVPEPSLLPNTVEKLACYYPAVLAIQGYRRADMEEARMWKKNESGKDVLVRINEGRMDVPLATHLAATVVSKSLDTYKKQALLSWRESESGISKKGEESDKRYQLEENFYLELSDMIAKDPEVQKEFLFPMHRFLTCLFVTDDLNTFQTKRYFPTYADDSKV
eukprot:m.16084 g.16084  ORF g.16084 m.16084 type:complete len:267 (-) comp4565_c0_seq1:495-1295(-)